MVIVDSRPYRNSIDASSILWFVCVFFILTGFALLWMVSSIYTVLSDIWIRTFWTNFIISNNFKNLSHQASDNIEHFLINCLFTDTIHFKWNPFLLQHAPLLWHSFNQNHHDTTRPTNSNSSAMAVALHIHTTSHRIE